ncbi:MAG: YbhB/YbcL family Raf kinase inhibitor-like protein [Rhodospirillaceae bacterium]
MFVRILLVAAFLATSASAQQRRPAPAQPMVMTSSAWKDGGVIPPKHAQPGDDVSPPLAWSQVPDGTESFVLIMRDLDAITIDGTDIHLYWMLWNIPKDARALAEALPETEELPDGTRQISSSGPWYRGPAAPPPGPAHHYAFELYALNARLDVPAVGQSPAATEAAVRAAMIGKIVGKGTLIGLFKRN